MENEIELIESTVQKEIDETKSLKDLEALKMVYFGSKGRFTLLTKKLGELPKQKRSMVGKSINELKKYLESLFDTKYQTLTTKHSADDWLDVTMPGKKINIGHLHPQTQVLHDLLEIFKSIGFQPAEGPEIETDWYNFCSLNFADDHPARETQQSLHLDSN